MSNIWYPGTPLPSTPVGASLPLAVPNMAALRAVLSAAFPSVYVEGYYTPGDGGGGWYYYQPTDLTTGCVFQGAIAGNVLTVTQILSGALKVGQIINGLGISNPGVGTSILSFGTGVGGTGTYNVSGAAQVLASTQLLADDNGTIVIGTDLISRWYAVSTDSLTYKKFGARGNATQDDTCFMQSAHNTGKVINGGYGSYLFSTLSFNVSGGLVGPGADYCYLNSSDVVNGGNTITVNLTNLEPGTKAPIFEKFTLVGQGTTKLNGNGISISAGTSENQGGKLRDVTLYNHPTCLAFGAASDWVVDECQFINYSRSGVVINNTNNADSGDNKIVNSFFGSSVGATPVGVSWIDGGGLTFTGNKINGGSYGILAALGTGNPTSIIQIVGNSIENQIVAAIQFARAAGTATLSNIIITDNELAINPNGIVFDASNAWNNLTIANNTIQLSPGTGTCIQLQSGNIFNIAGNTLTGNGGASPAGIVIAAACTNGKIGVNTYSTLTSYLVNNSATTTVTWDIQTGTIGPTSGNAAYGTLFSSSINGVVFPKPFKQLNSVMLNCPTGVGGIVGCHAQVQSVTGFSALAVTATNNVIGSLQYTAFGLL